MYDWDELYWSEKSRMYKDCVVDYQTEINPGVFVVTLNVGEMAEETLAGQFVMIKCWEDSDPFLMRPISVNSVDRQGGTMTLLYTVKGKGTRLLSGLQIGDIVQVLGPVGSPFPMIDRNWNCATSSSGSGLYQRGNRSICVSFGKERNTSF